MDASRIHIHMLARLPVLRLIVWTFTCEWRLQTQRKYELHLVSWNQSFINEACVVAEWYGVNLEW